MLQEHGTSEQRGSVLSSSPSLLNSGGGPRIDPRKKHCADSSSIIRLIFQKWRVRHRQRWDVQCLQMGRRNLQYRRIIIESWNSLG